MKANVICAPGAMPEAEREQMLATALGEDDDVLIGAVIEQPAPISGISKARQQVLRGAWQKPHTVPTSTASRA